MRTAKHGRKEICTHRNGDQLQRRIAHYDVHCVQQAEQEDDHRLLHIQVWEGRLIWEEVEAEHQPRPHSAAERMQRRHRIWEGEVVQHVFVVQRQGQVERKVQQDPYARANWFAWAIGDLAEQPAERHKALDEAPQRLEGRASAETGLGVGGRWGTGKEGVDAGCGR